MNKIFGYILLALAALALYGVIFMGATHQLLIFFGCLALGTVLLAEAYSEKRKKKDTYRF